MNDDQILEWIAREDPQQLEFVAVGAIRGSRQ